MRLVGYLWIVGMLSCGVQAATPLYLEGYEVSEPAPPTTNMEEALQWLSKQPPPKLENADAKLTSLLRKELKLGGGAEVKRAVVAGARVTGVGVPKVYLWVQAQVKRRMVFEGAVILSFDEAGAIHLYRYASKADLGKDLSGIDNLFPRDGAVRARTLISSLDAKK